MPTPIVHALLAPSAADRWIHCPGSVAANENAPRRDTIYTREGTLAHSLSELKLRKHFGLCPNGARRPIGPRKYKSDLEKLQANELYQPEMDGYTDTYVDYIIDIANSFDSRPAVFVEQDLNLETFVPGSFGQADCILLHGTDLYVNDFKYGKGVSVDAPDNPQLRLYALGALMAYKDFWQIDTVHMTIIQPRLDHISEDTMSADDLTNWGVFTIRPAAQKANDRTPEYHHGKWCRWCAISATCRENANASMQPVEKCLGKLPPALSMDEFALLLHKLDPLERYIKQAREYAETALLSGTDIPGWKLVESRSKYIWDDQNEAFKKLSDSGVKEAMLWHREPYTLAQIKKQLGKKAFDELVGNHVIHQPGKPALAPEEDNRPIYSTRANADDDFKDLIKKGDTNHAE